MKRITLTLCLLIFPAIIDAGCLSDYETMKDEAYLRRDTAQEKLAQRVRDAKSAHYAEAVRLEQEINSKHIATLNHELNVAAIITIQLDAKFDNGEITDSQHKQSLANLGLALSARVSSILSSLSLDNLALIGALEVKYTNEVVPIITECDRLDAAYERRLKRELAEASKRYWKCLKPWEL